jgi:hypothetical protein
MKIVVEWVWKWALLAVLAAGVFVLYSGVCSLAEIAGKL